VKELILKRILTGAYAPGDRLVETRIAQELGTSQAPVREALRDLELLRFVESAPFKGSRVREVANEELLEIYPVRAALEELGARGRGDPAPPRTVRRVPERRAAVTRLVDLSMPVHPDMLTFPRVPPPMLMLYESWTDFAERIGAAQYGAKSLTASYVVVQNDHVGTHVDAVKHIRGPEAPGVEGIPLDYCFAAGVVLDVPHKEKGTRIFPDEIGEALTKIEDRL